MLVFRPDANYIRYRILQVYQLCFSNSSASPSISPSWEAGPAGMYGAAGRAAAASPPGRTLRQPLTEAGC